LRGLRVHDLRQGRARLAGQGGTAMAGGRLGGVLSEDFPVLAGFRVGSLVAGYRLEAQVGAGGMAVVFRARDERLGRLVALKILSPALAADAGFRRRFIAESRAAAAVDDPHIIPVFEAGESGGVLFIAMRFVAGGDLRAVLDREGPLPPGRAAEFLSPVASALDAAHRAGLVHRDVKPANILVDAEPGRPDHVYLSDFGVSKGAVSSVSVTGTGYFLGTPDYSAPEQVQGRAVDGRADQYALACVAFQLLTGTVPFERDQGMAVLLAHLSELPPLLSSQRPDLPGAAGQVLGRGMAKAPEERYGSCRDFADALREALGVAPYTSLGTAAPGHPPAAPGHPPTQAAAPPARPPAPDPAVTAAPAGLPDPAAALTVDAAPRGGQASTADVPARLARAAGWPGSFRLRAAVALAAILAVAGGLTALALPSGGTGNHSGSHSSGQHSPGTRPSPSTQPKIPQLITTLTDPNANSGIQSAVDSVAFSPDGTTLAVGDDDYSTYLWSLASRTITATLTAPNSLNVYSVAFSPHGTTLAVGDDEGITYLWSLATRTITATLTRPGLSYQANSVAFSPDGATLAVGTIHGTYLWSLASRTITATLTDPGSYHWVDSVAFSPDGATLAVGDENGSTYLWSLASRTITATLTAPGSHGNVNSVAFSRDGTTLAVGDSDGKTYLWRLATRAITATLTAPGSHNTVDSVAFSPDGTTLAVGDLNGSTYLWSLASRTITATLTDPGGKGVESVAFNPAGTTLAAGDYNDRTYLWSLPGHASS
jgi:sugar lactone lactonase YvrE